MTNLKTKGAKSMRRLVIASTLSTGLFFSAALPGTGQPTQSCQDLGVIRTAFTTAGFVHAEAVYAGSPGTKSLANGNAHAVSQYDVACFQQSTH